MTITVAFTAVFCVNRVIQIKHNLDVDPLRGFSQKYARIYRPNALGH
jgi:hypothetical protein